MGVDDRCVATEVLNLAMLDELPRPARQLLHDAVLEVAKLRQVDRWFAERDAPLARMFRLVEQIRYVQKGLRRNASTVDTDAAGIQLGIDERRRQTQIGGEKRRRVPAGAGADNDDLDGDHRMGRRSGEAFPTPLARIPSELRRDTPKRPREGGALLRRNVVIPEAPGRTAARALRRPSAGTGSRRRRR